MNAAAALTNSAAAVPLTMMTTATTSTTTASAASEIISPTLSFNAFNSSANALGHLSSRKDYYARTDLAFLVVFPLLFLAFNLCYWGSLFFWRSDEENNLGPP